MSPRLEAVASPLEDSRRSADARRRALFLAAMQRMRSWGFSSREAPFAAMAAFTIQALGSKPTPEEVRRRMEAQYPWLSEPHPDDQQGGQAA